MKFNNPKYENEELTYDDVFIFQQYFEGKSRLTDITINPNTKLNINIPIISANMNAVTGKRMAETLARYGGLGILPQDMKIDKIIEIIKFVKSRHIEFDTPLTVTEDNYVRDVLSIINKRAHNCVIMVDKNNKPLSIFTAKDLMEYEQFTILGKIKKHNLIKGFLDISPEEAYNIMIENSISSLPIIDKNGILQGIITKKDAVRKGIYKPTLDKKGKLNIGVALGINNFLEKALILADIGVNIFVLDTAHGFQKIMIDAIKKFRKELAGDYTLIAGNVCTKEGTRALIEAGADGVKVGIGPGAMCTTRIMTGVGRPQFSAVYECSKMAKQMGGFVVADGGIKEPRDLVLSIAAGAKFVMMGSIFTGTFESTGDIHYDSDGFMYKQNYGMASGKAVLLRNSEMSLFEQAKKALFKEGISTSKIYLQEGQKSVGNIVDNFTTGLRSAMTYVGAKNLEEFNEKAIIGVQTNAGFLEGTPHGKIKK